MFTRLDTIPNVMVGLRDRQADGWTPDDSRDRANAWRRAVTMLLFFFSCCQLIYEHFRFSVTHGWKVMMRWTLCNLFWNARYIQQFNLYCRCLPFAINHIRGLHTYTAKSNYNTPGSYSRVLCCSTVGDGCSAVNPRHIASQWLWVRGLLKMCYVLELVSAAHNGGGICVG